MYPKSTAAALGFAQAEYSVGYMLYKGLGCTQDYPRAVEVFRKGASEGYDNAMYFLALCLRNGYGTERDTARAMAWLRKADSLGSTQARTELAQLSAENRADSAKELLEGIRNLALPRQGPAGQFVRIATKVPAAEAVGGRYAGYLLQYDWSGASVVGTRGLVLDVTVSGQRLSGQWVEQGADSFRFSGYLRGDSLVFDPVSYGRRDHYSPDSAVGYELRNATLSLVQAPDAVYLAGNLSMFSGQRGEPSKPVVLALARTSEERLPDVRLRVDRVFPNPFRDVLDVQFTLGADATVEISMTGVAGQQVFVRPGQRLQAGSYTNRLQLPAGMAPGVYLLRLTANGKPYTVKLAHLQ